MHTALLQLLAAARMRDRIAEAEDRRRAHQGRRARPVGRFRLKARPGQSAQAARDGNGRYGSVAPGRSSS